MKQQMNEAKKNNNTLAAMLSGECLMAASTEHPITNRTKKKMIRLCT